LTVHLKHENELKSSQSGSEFHALDGCKNSVDIKMPNLHKVKNAAGY